MHPKVALYAKKETELSFPGNLLTLAHSSHTTSKGLAVPTTELEPALSAIVNCPYFSGSQTKQAPGNNTGTSEHRDIISTLILGPLNWPVPPEP